MSSFSKSASQRSGMMAGQSEPNRTRSLSRAGKTRLFSDSKTSASRKKRVTLMRMSRNRASISALVATLLAYRNFFTPAAQLREL